jgi:hypothetical protein
MNLMKSLDEYERLITPARERFAVSPAIQAMESTSDDVFLELFLLNFCALGSQMTEPVEGWIRRAAERCAAIGLSEVAVALTGHAQAEAGHHLMMRADVRSLAARWNVRREPAVDADKLLNQTLSPGVLHYRKVHEENIAGDTPYAQIAIEYEVEMLPLRYGEPLLNRCVKMLGAEILPCLSFVTEHIVLDVGHTNFNARLLAKVMGLSASSMPALVSAGTAALDAYAEFLGDCVLLANRDSRKTRT